MEYETPQFFHVMQYAAEADHDVVDMVSGNPDWEPPAALREGLRDYAGLDCEHFDYPPTDGLVTLREEIAARRNVDVDQVILTNGAGEANYLAMAEALARTAGDEVVMTEPVYPYYPGKTSMLGGTHRYVETDEDGQLDPESVEATTSGETAAIVINSPNNPTGAVYPAETIEKLVSIAEEADAILVSDEVYDHFDFTGQFTSALSTDSPNRIVTNSFSKSMAITGFRVGYAVFPQALVSSARSRHMLVNVAGSRPAQYAVLRALEETSPDYYEEKRAMLRDRMQRFTSALDAVGADYTRPQGSFYVLVKFDGFPGTLSGVKRLIDEAGVAGMPGAAFGESRVDWLRFALVTPRVDEAAERLGSYFEQLA